MSIVFDEVVAVRGLVQVLLGFDAGKTPRKYRKVRRTTMPAVAVSKKIPFTTVSMSLINKVRDALNAEYLPYLLLFWCTSEYILGLGGESYLPS
jgi:hypothetical protein